MDKEIEHGSHPDTSTSSSLHEGLHGGTSETLLISGLEVSSVGAFVFACICIAVVAFLLEIARHFTSVYESKMKMMHEEKMNLITSSFENSELTSLIILGFLYSSSYLVGTLLMLVAMTYNIYLIISVCFGITAGKLLSVHLKFRIPRR